MKITEMWEPLIKVPPITYYVGRELRSFRILYWKLTKKWWWGIAQFVVDKVGGNRR